MFIEPCSIEVTVPPGCRLISKPTQTSLGSSGAARLSISCVWLKLAGPGSASRKHGGVGLYKMPTKLCMSIPLFSVAWCSEPPLQAFIFCYQSTW